MPGAVGVSGGWDIPTYFGKKFTGEHDWEAQSPGLQQKKSDEERALGLESRGTQQELGTAIQDRALGRGGPSVAENQLRQAQATNVLAARSAGASARGGNVALGNRMAAQGQAQAMGQTAGQAATLRAQEQIAAQQLASQHIGQQRQQDLLARGYSIDEAKAILDAEMKAQQLNKEIAEGTAERGQGVAGMAIGAIGGLAALSDIRAKEDIKPLYSDFYDKEFARTQPGSVMLGYDPRTAAPQGNPMFAGNVAPQQQPPPLQPAQLQVAPQQDNTSAVEKQQADMKQNRLLAAMESGQKAGGKNSASEGLLAGMQLGSMLSDYTAKEPTLADLDAAERDAIARVNAPVTPVQSRRDLGPVQPVQYRYRPEASARMAAETGATPAERAMVYEDKRSPREGIIAQDLERSPAFAPSVVETPAGKAVHRDRALSTALAELGGLDKRQRQIEQRLREVERPEYPTPRQPGEPAPEKKRPKARGGR